MAFSATYWVFLQILWCNALVWNHTHCSLLELKVESEKIPTFTSWKSRCSFPAWLAASVCGRRAKDVYFINKCLFLSPQGGYDNLLYYYYFIMPVCLADGEAFFPHSGDQCCSCFGNMNWVDLYEMKISCQQPCRFDDDWHWWKQYLSNNMFITIYVP